MRTNLSRFVFALGLFAFTSIAQGQLTITGVTDKYYNYSDSVTFTVGAQPGFSYLALLDTNRVPTGVPVTVNEVDYHELRVTATNLTTGATTNALVRFIVQSSARSSKGATENGLPPWTPWPVINSASNEFAGANLHLIVPQDFPANYEIPAVAWIMNPQGHPVRVNGLVTAPGQPSFQVKRGVGSGLLSSNTPAGSFTYAAQIRGLATNKVINIESAPAWTSVSGTISANTLWDAGAHIYVAGTLTIAAGATVTVNPGAIVRIAPGADIFLDGKFVLNGTVDRPIVFMPNSHSQPWGGFWLRTATSQITGTGTIFTGSGANQNWFGTGGRPSSHRSEQALFYCTNRASITLTDSAAVWLAGQLSHSAGGGLFFFNYNRFLCQHNTSGGEHTDSVWTVNDSAFIDSYLDSPPFSTFYDGDEDALYIVNIPTGYVSGFTNTLVGWTRDDGVDSGGSGPGVLNFKSCWFEAIYHEGNSLSGVQSASPHADKMVTHIDGVFLGVGQGVENGYGAVTNLVDHCLMLGNLCGVRFGDNYNWGYYGRTTATNSILINNYRDVWGMTWQTDTSGPYEGWLYRTNQMDVRSNLLTAPNPYHPSNSIWNPATDAWRLTAFMTTPPEAPVGIAFATWTNQFAMATLFDGVPVGLSTFTTNTVSVNFAFVTTGNVTLATGTLTFAPGETLKRIYPAGFDASAISQLRVVLGNPVLAELTGETNVLFTGSLATPTANCWLAGNQVDLARIGEGVPLKLTGPSAQPVTVPCKFEGSGGMIQSGTATFAPGDTVNWVALANAVPAPEQLVCFSLGAPVWAQLGSASNVFFVKTITSPSTNSTMLIARGATWKYYDTVTNAVAGWMTTNFNDSAWAGGPSPLGYGNTPTEATTVGYGPNSSAKYISTYFRKYFVVTNVTGLASATFNLLRDDGAVVYLNGAEVFRENLPAGTISYSTLATTNVSGTATVWSSRTIATSALPQPLREGTNVLAVEIHQSGGTSSDIILNLDLAGNPPPATPLQPLLCQGRFDGRFVLAWGDPGFLLEETVALGPEAHWSTVTETGPAAIVFDGPQRFYRLRQK